MTEDDVFELLPKIFQKDHLNLPSPAPIAHTLHKDCFPWIKDLRELYLVITLYLVCSFVISGTADIHCLFTWLPESRFTNFQVSVEHPVNHWLRIRHNDFVLQPCK